MLPQLPTESDEDDEDVFGPPANRIGRAPMRAAAANASTPQMRWEGVGGGSGGGAEEKKKDAGVSSTDKIGKLILDAAKKKRRKEESEAKEVRRSFAHRLFVRRIFGTTGRRGLPTPRSNHRD